MSSNLALLTLVPILLIAPLAAGAALLVQAETALVQRLESNTAALADLSGVADAVLTLLSARDGMEPDSFLDPVYTDIDALAEKSGTVVAVRDLSSRFNLNTLQKNMISGTELRSFLKPGISTAALQQYREDEGFSLNIAGHYGDYFEAEALTDYLTGWGYWNINTADEFSLARIFALRTDDEFAAEQFHRRIREGLKKGLLITPDTLEPFMGVDAYTRLFPVINARPPINVNTVDEWTLTQLLSYKAYQVVSPATVMEKIIALRRTRPIRTEELTHLVTVDESAEKNRLFAWLGDTVWFMEICVTDRSGRRLTRVIARLPEKDSTGGGRRYRIVMEEIPW